MIDKPNILFSLSKASIAEVDSQTLSKCRHAYKKLVCDHVSIITHLTSAYAGCPKSLMLNSWQGETGCRFKYADESSMAMTTKTATYLFFSSPTEVFLKCGENDTITKTMRGNTRVGTGCGVRSSTWQIPATKKISEDYVKRVHGFNVSENVALPRLQKLKLTNIKKIEEKSFLTKRSHHTITITSLVLVLLVVLGSVIITVIYVIRKVNPKFSPDPVGVVCSMNELRNNSVLDAGPMEEMHSDEVVSGPQGQHNIVFVED